MTDDTRPQTALEFDHINWKTSLFLVATLVISAIATPIYWLQLGIGWMEITLFLGTVLLTGLSITAGYHRLFTHCTYRARWPVRLSVLLFGAGTFQMSALRWASDHRYHHKYTDEDGDPYDPHSIRKGFFWAHVGWLLVHVTPARRNTNVEDLRRDPLVMWQHKNYIAIAIAMGFLLPTALGGLWGLLASGTFWMGALGGLLFGGFVRIVLVHHATFSINSWAHMIGRRPYDRQSTARDSGLVALMTFGEGYHNFHHAFQTDYRNGVRAWHFDPAKWLIYLASKMGLASDLRRVPGETIRLARLRAKRQLLEGRLATVRTEFRDNLQAVLETLEAKLEERHLRLRQLLVRTSRLGEDRRARRTAQWTQLQEELREVRRELKAHFRAWRRAHRLALALAA